MAYRKTLLCLARSHKEGQYCVAGREVLGGGFGPWIRPVSARKFGELTEAEMTCADGRLVEVLDRVDVTLERPRPHDHQPENHLATAGVAWQRKRRAGYAELLDALDADTLTLWPNGFSSKRGENNRVPWDVARTLDHSLRLIRVSSFFLLAAIEEHSPPDPSFRLTWRMRTRAAFTYHGIPYVFSVTDPYVEKITEKLGEGCHSFGEAVFCVSLGECYEGHCYKLAATIITPRRADGVR